MGNITQSQQEIHVNTLQSKESNILYLNSIRKIQVNYKKYISKKKLSHETLLKYKKIMDSFENNTKFEYLSRRKLKESFRSLEIYDSILKNSEQSEFFSKNNEKIDFSSFSFRTKLPVKVNIDDQSFVIYDGSWNLNQEFSGFGVMFYIDSQKRIEYDFDIKFNIIDDSNMFIFTKVISGIFLNGDIVPEFIYRIFYSNGLVYEGQIKKEFENNKFKFIPFGEGRIFKLSDLNNRQVNKISNSNEEKSIFKYIHTEFVSDLTPKPDSKVFYYYKQFSIVKRNKENSGTIYTSNSIFSGIFKLNEDNENNNQKSKRSIDCIDYIDGLMKYSNGNIYQGGFKNGVFHSKGVLFETEENIKLRLENEMKNKKKLEKLTPLLLNYKVEDYNFLEGIDLNESNKSNYNLTIMNLSMISHSHNHTNSQSIVKNQSKTPDIPNNSHNQHNKYNKYDEVSFEKTTKLNQDDIENIEKINDENVDSSIWGNGIYIKGNFLNGKLNGSGVIINTSSNKKKKIHVIWRLSKLIYTKEYINKDKNRKFNIKILDYIPISALLDYISIKNSSFFRFFKQNSLKFLPIRLMKSIEYNNMNENTSQAYQINNEYLYKILFQTKEIVYKSIFSIILQSLLGINVYLPLFPFFISTGCYNKDFYYTNIHNPDLNKVYFSNFLHNTKNDIDISSSLDSNSVFRSFIKNSQNLNEYIIDIINNNKASKLGTMDGVDYEILYDNKNFSQIIERVGKKEIFLFLQRFIFNKSQKIGKISKVGEGIRKKMFGFNHLKNKIIMKVKRNSLKPIEENGNLYVKVHNELSKFIINNTKQIDFHSSHIRKVNTKPSNTSMIEVKTSSFKSFLDDINYKYNIESEVIDDSYLLKSNYNPSLYFSLGMIIIDNSSKHENSVILHNPVKTLAVYISNEYDENEEHINNHKAQDDIMSNRISNKTVEEIVLILSNHYLIQRIDQNHDSTLIEIDSQKVVGNSKDYERKGKRLVAVIILNSQTRHIIKLNEYYHIGRFVHIRLVDQHSLYTKKVTTMDVSSILFFGKIFNWEKD